MVTATKNTVDTLFSSTTANISSKSTSKTDATYNKEFKEILSSKTNSKESDTDKVDSINSNETETEDNTAAVDDNTNVDDTTETDDLKDDLEELEEESKSASKDQINDILAELMSLLEKLGGNNEEIKLNVQVNSDNIKSIIEGINGEETSNNSLNSIMENLVKLLETDSVKKGLDTDSLKTIENILTNLASNMADDDTESAKDTKNIIKDLTSQITNLLDSKQSQSEKVLTLEEVINKNYSQSNDENSTESESDNSTNSKDTSKQDKFLSSLLDDNSDNSTNKINLFAARTQIIQNQAVNTTSNGLTINKATFTDDLIKDVKYMSNNGIKELTVKINPGNLGEITIKLAEEDGVMKANLKANSKETAALLAQNLAEVKNHLSEQNIKIADVNIEIYQEDTTFFNGEGQLSQEQQKSGSTNSEGVEMNTDDSLDEDLQAISNGSVNFLA